MQRIEVGTRLRGADLGAFLSPLPRDAKALDVLRPGGWHELHSNHFGLASIKVTAAKDAANVLASGSVMSMFLLYSAVRELNRLYRGSDGLEWRADGKPMAIDSLARDLYSARLEAAKYEWLRD